MRREVLGRFRIAVATVAALNLVAGMDVALAEPVSHYEQLRRTIVLRSGRLLFSRQLSATTANSREHSTGSRNIRRICESCFRGSACRGYQFRRRTRYRTS
jgi:hypothetical protein